ncbi:MAG TPA: Asp-tRNA(Asn)/Glu-tRNA(Gln) amidotransferase subunit GatC [candidate division Zixibacteria bacterium]|nr:Asp-tRNA(Asn)/Glu-tRNA(Gln) amidotransferase subunit GatC [candidate division Zixibacteria bacterium]
MPQVNLQIDRIARLARIKISPEEATQLNRDLEEIAGYFDQIRQIDTTSVNPAGSGSEAIPGRPDRAIESIAQNEALGNAPQADGRFFLVPKVIDK